MLQVTTISEMKPAPLAIPGVVELGLGFNRDSAILCDLRQVYVAFLSLCYLTHRMGEKKMDYTGMCWELSEILFLWFLIHGLGI